MLRCAYSFNRRLVHWLLKTHPSMFIYSSMVSSSQKHCFRAIKSAAWLLFAIPNSTWFLEKYWNNTPSSSHFTHPYNWKPWTLCKKITCESVKHILKPFFFQCWMKENAIQFNSQICLLCLFNFLRSDAWVTHSCSSFKQLFAWFWRWKMFGRVVKPCRMLDNRKGIIDVSSCWSMFTSGVKLSVSFEHSSVHL